jgi:hypothetical protein
MRERLMIMFSGQRDAVALCAASADQFPHCDIVLAYVKNIGLRARSEPPLETARALHARYPNVRFLIVGDGRALQAALFKEMSTQQVASLGVRSICLGCSGSLRMILNALAHSLHCRPVQMPHEVLGPAIEEALAPLSCSLDAVCVHGATQSRYANILSTIPIDASERCAIAAHHGGALRSDERTEVEFHSWQRAILSGGPKFDHRDARVIDLSDDPRTGRSYDLAHLLNSTE